MDEYLEKEFDDLLNDEVFLYEFGEQEVEALTELRKINTSESKIAIMKLLKYYYENGYAIGKTNGEFLYDEEDEDEDEDENLEEENDIKDDCISEEEISSNLC